MATTTIRLQNQEQSQLSMNPQSTPILNFLSKGKNKSELKKQLTALREAQKRNDTPSVAILDYKVIDEFVLYRIKITRGSATWTFQTRYSLLRQLRDKLPVDLLAKLPQFPSKRLLANLQKEFIDKRMAQLNTFLKVLISINQALFEHKTSIVKQFIKQSRAAAIEINDPHMKQYKLE